MSSLPDLRSPAIEPRWYRQFWPWVLIALPATAVVASLVTAYLALRAPDGLVVDDYYKEGLAINRRYERSLAAQALGLEGELRLAGGGGTAELVLKTASGAALPDTVRLQLLHATRAGLDREVDARRSAPGVYTVNLPALAAGRWSVQAGAADWRLDGVIEIPGETRVSLRAAR